MNTEGTRTSNEGNRKGAAPNKGRQDTALQPCQDMRRGRQADWLRTARPLQKGEEIMTSLCQRRRFRNAGGLAVAKGTTIWEEQAWKGDCDVRHDNGDLPDGQPALQGLPSCHLGTALKAKLDFIPLCPEAIEATPRAYFKARGPRGLDTCYSSVPNQNAHLCTAMLFEEPIRQDGHGLLVGRRRLGASGQ